MAFAKGWPSRFRSVQDMPPEVGDGLFHLLQWESAQLVTEAERAEQVGREREVFEQLQRASFGGYQGP
jgi:hypothetical protein